jgi:hypothetical protein
LIEALLVFSHSALLGLLGSGNARGHSINECPDLCADTLELTGELHSSRLRTTESGFKLLKLARRITWECTGVDQRLSALPECLQSFLQMKPLCLTRLFRHLFSRLRRSLNYLNRWPGCNNHLLCFPLWLQGF